MSDLVFVMDVIPGWNLPACVIGHDSVLLCHPILMGHRVPRFPDTAIAVGEFQWSMALHVFAASKRRLVAPACTMPLNYESLRRAPALAESLLSPLSITVLRVPNELFPTGLAEAISGVRRYEN